MEEAEIFEHLGGKAQSLWFCVCNFSLFVWSCDAWMFH